MNAGSVTALDNLAPSVNMTGAFNNRLAFGVRGISSTANTQTVGLSSGVEDVASIEMLNGPQSTLGGRMR